MQHIHVNVYPMFLLQDEFARYKIWYPHVINIAHGLSSGELECPGNLTHPLAILKTYVFRRWDMLFHTQGAIKISNKNIIYIYMICT